MNTFPSLPIVEKLGPHETSEKTVYNTYIYGFM